uniref:DIP1984 family protein n=1 Tax=Vaginimicrobium propionicum TaxID=1871034 RepID=UPI000970915A|nr:DIP1984 family protein [Vaginimicrobium propionicum]
MLLAEALAQRADITRRIDQLRIRLTGVARVQEGESPDEDPAALLNEINNLLGQLEVLIRRINATNSRTLFEDVGTLTDALARRDVLAKKREILVSVADAAATRQDRFSRQEIKYVATMNVTQLRSEADEAARAYRDLDTEIQRINWSTELS